MGPGRALKRTRAGDQLNFWEDSEDDGVYLTITLASGNPLKGRGWPYIQQCVRAILGEREKLAKASFQNDGSLLVKTKDSHQTDKLLKVKWFGADECVVEKTSRLNTSKGTIHAIDMINLSEDEIVSWLAEYGVIGAKRFTRMVNGRKESTPTILLTFDRPVCPTRLTFDYVTYQVRRHIPNPLICNKCGKFGHPEVKCEAEKQLCLNCGEEQHDGTCAAKCINCEKVGHSCRSRECSFWKREREICVLKVEKDISYAQARREYKESHQAPTIRQYSSVVRTPSESFGKETVAEGIIKRVEKLEEKMDRIILLLDKQNTDKQANTTMETQLDAPLADPSQQMGTPTLSTVGPTQPEASGELSTTEHVLEPTVTDSDMEQDLATVPPSADGSTPNEPGKAKAEGRPRTEGRPCWVTSGSNKKKHKQTNKDPPTSQVIGRRRGNVQSGNGSTEKSMPSLTREAYNMTP